MRLKRLIILVLFALTVSLAGATHAGSGGYTVGRFLVEIVSAKGPAATSPDQAARTLRAAGYQLPNLPLDAALTEGAVTEIAIALGIKVTTRSPNAQFSGSQVDAFLTTFGPEIRGGCQPQGNGNGNGQGNGNGADPRTKGKGWKKGLYKSHHQPD